MPSSAHQWRGSLKDTIILAVRVLGGPGSGNFGHEGRPGEIGGSGGGGDKASKVKQKHTKEQIAKAMEMKKAGASSSAIQKETGLHPSTQYHHYQKLVKTQSEVKKELQKPSEKPVVTAPPTTTTTTTAPLEAAKPTGGLSAKAQEYGYEWKEKTSGPSAGKYAYFKNGIQVSSPFEKGKMEEAAASLHYNTGPKAPTPESTQNSPATKADGWPIDPDVTRAIGSTYEGTVATAYQGWAKGLPGEERSAVQVYTGNGYKAMNDVLRSGKPDSIATHDRIKALTSALDKAPKPPPPELVWRGVNAKGAAVLGDLKIGSSVQLKGFQSTSLHPLLGAKWGSTFLEIKPSKGAYVGSISWHKNEKEYVLPHGHTYTIKGVGHVNVQGHFGPERVRVVQLQMH